MRGVRMGRPQVISLGGGAFTIQDNFELATNHGVTVWLDAPIEVIERRIAEVTHRPLARDPERLRALYENRRAAYARAHYRIETFDDDAGRIVARILALPLFAPVSLDARTADFSRRAPGRRSGARGAGPCQFDERALVADGAAIRISRISTAFR